MRQLEIPGVWLVICLFGPDFYLIHRRSAEPRNDYLVVFIDLIYLRVCRYVVRVNSCCTSFGSA